MTQIGMQFISCAVCGTESMQTEMSSTSAFGSPDLDTRPAETARFSIFAWVHRCPGCGYCAADLARGQQGAKKVLARSEYIEQLADANYPELANSFLCKAMIDGAHGSKSEAAWSVIHAAWVCDDEDKPEQAAACRRRAAQMLVQAEDGGEIFAEQDDASSAILVDLLRRSGQFAEAREEIEKRIGGIKEDTAHKVLRYEMSLIEASDSTCHTLDEALEM